MMSNVTGFYISRLQVAGYNLKPANLSFRKGLNVVSGPSDTGKSYIFSCINYMLGGSELPDEIPLGHIYTNILLEIKTYDDRTYTLKRNINGGNFTLKEVELDSFESFEKAIELKSNHTHSTDDNISTFLLKLSGFQEAVIKTNNQNEKRALSFRDIAKLTLIDEERIITKKSPVYTSNQYTNQTQEKSILEYILTGKDATSLKKIETPKVYSSRILGKLEFIDSIIQNLSSKIYKLESEIPENKQKELNLRISELSIILLESNKKLELLTEQKKTLFNNINSLESKNLLQSEIINRFSLLGEHYLSDIKRLDFITEGEQYFSQLNSIKCPLCGSDIDSDHYNCMIQDTKINSNIILSIEIEKEKIRRKHSELDDTLSNLILEKSKNDLLILNLKTEYEEIDLNINRNIAPISFNIKNEIDELLNELSLNRELLLIKNQVHDYQKQKSVLELELSKKPKAEISADTYSGNIFKKLTDIIEGILVRWNFSDIVNIIFDDSYKTFDIVINNKKRNSNGKGIKAITYSSFVIGLMDYCIENNLPHSRNIVLDSPLTTYHGKDQNKAQNTVEDAPRNMQEAFFNDLATISDNKQIIILDNKYPEESLRSKINYIHFTDDEKVGRQGFLPG